MSTFRSIMNHCVFGLEMRNYHETDYAKSLCISAGGDSFDDIGVPRGARREDFLESNSLESKFDEWMRSVAEYFPPTIKSSGTADPAGDQDNMTTEDLCKGEFAEPVVDTMFERQKTELRQYLTDMERRANLSKDMSSGKGIRSKRRGSESKTRSGDMKTRSSRK